MGCIFIEEPQSRLTLPDIFTFANLKTPSGLQLIGSIQDRKDFSRLLPITGVHKNKMFLERFIKAPGTGFYIPDDLKHLQQPVSEAIRHHYAMGHDTDRDYANIIVMQATRAFLGMGPHIDASYDDMMTGIFRNNHSYIAYDGYPTLFYDQPFEIQEDGKFKTYEGRVQEVEKISDQLYHQARNASIKCFDPFSLVYFDATAVHMADDFDAETPRTVCIIAFRHFGYDLPLQKINNPDLVQAMQNIEARRRQDSKMMPRP